jgi:pimeloyl-ACP methyl ester carboxylesterase
MRRNTIGDGRMRRYGSFLEWAVLIVALPACSSAVESTESASDDADSSVQSALKVERDEGEEVDALSIDCSQLLSSLEYPETVFTSAISVAEGEFPQPGQIIPAHCLVTGKMFERVSPVDGNTYSIGFEIRLPLTWKKRRFFYQANGGIDGAVVPAIGATSGGGPLKSALQKGFAVISSDAGHDAAQNPFFGIDPQARLDFGYQAVGKLTPMAKKVVRLAYGKKPKWSYIGGCSNGGRHAMVAAARYANEYDGYLVGSPGFNLPKAAIASVYGAQQYVQLWQGETIPAGPFVGLPDLSVAFTQVERQLLSLQVLERCDALDGVRDGMVQDTQGCQAIFDLDTDVPTCPGARDGTCLSAFQKVIVGNIFGGAKTSTQIPIYSSFPFDSGHAAGDSAFWEFISPLILDPGAVAFVFGTPPADPVAFNPVGFALGFPIDLMYASTFATTPTYTESSQSFMVPPALDGFHRHGRRMLIYHGASDPIFSAEDTVKWLEELDPADRAAARLYLVPGMSHCAGGPSTDQFDLLKPLIRWVERREAPERVIASARGPANPGGPNFDLPPAWSPDRTRPLCPYPRVATYHGGNIERASSFHCE